MPVLLETLDAKIASTLADWNLYTTLIALSITAFLAYPILYPDEPDTHPLLLARQSTPAPVRNRNESAVYRSLEIPHGYPLKTGLNVKEPGAPRWQSGRDGDLRDVWREVCKGGQSAGEGKEVPKGRVLSVHGRESVEEHDVEGLSKEINVLGQYLSESGGKRVAVYMPNSIELLLAIFACAFYGQTPILLPFNSSADQIYTLLKDSAADSLICEAGTLPLDGISKHCTALRSLTWVVEKSSRQMDWSGSPRSSLRVSTLHDLIAASPADSTLPSNSDIPTLGDVVIATASPTTSPKPVLTTFTHAHLAAATSALLTSLPLRQRLTPSDLFLPATPLTASYTLCWTLATLYSHASLALTSSAAPGVDFALATRGVAPTIVLAGPETLAALHAEEAEKRRSAMAKLGTWIQSRALEAGRMPTPSNPLARALLPPPSRVTEPGKLRLLLTPQPLSSPPLLLAQQISDLRLYTHARIVTALVVPQVAGAVTQTHVFDYRAGGAGYGAPIGSVEVWVKGKEGDVGGTEPSGQVCVAGPAVVGGTWESGAEGVVGGDGCLRVVRGSR